MNRANWSSYSSGVSVGQGAAHGLFATELERLVRDLLTFFGSRA